MKQILSQAALLILFLGLSACSTFEITPTVVQDLDPKIYYRHDMKITINGSQKGRGVIVAKRAPSYLIEVEAPGQIDLVKLTTCHRQNSSEDEGISEKRTFFWRNKGRTFTYRYTPTPDIEASGSCMMLIEAHEQGVEGRHSSALIEFEEAKDSRYTLPAVVTCNGEHRARRGVDICMSWAKDNESGLRQEIDFPVPVDISDKIPDRCKIPEPADGKTWGFSIPNRECTIVFEQVSKPHSLFRLQTVGYEEIPIRGE